MRVAHNRLEPMMGSVFPNIVSVQHTEVRELLLRSRFSYPLQALCARVPSHAESLLPSSRPRTGFSSTSFPDSNPYDNVSLLCFVSECAGPFQSCGKFDAMHRGLSSPFYGQLTQMLFEPCLLPLIPTLDEVLVDAHWLFRPQPNLPDA